MKYIFRRVVCPAFRLAMLGLCCGLAACNVAGEATAGAAPSGGKTIGLLLSGYDMAFDSDGKKACPHGFTDSTSNLANWEAQFPTQVERRKHLARCGTTENRGPDCESVWVRPELVKDLLPRPVVEGATANGVNLDGTEDGRETATTCAHQKFASPAGKPGIDNQFYRLFGCEGQVRSYSDSPAAIRKFLRQFGPRLLLRVHGVDDEVNDDHVEATLYTGRDSLVVDAEEKAVPSQSQRIDESIPPQSMRGRIVNGELITDPTDTVWSEVGPPRAHFWLRGASLRLRLTATGAEGWRVGYIDTGQLWEAYRIGAQQSGPIWSSGPGLYEAMQRLADGNKDPKTGKCTSLSSAMRMEFVRAYIEQPETGS